MQLTRSDDPGHKTENSRNATDKTQTDNKQQLRQKNNQITAVILLYTVNAIMTTRPALLR